MPVNIAQCIDIPSFIDCDGNPLIPVSPVDLTQYDKFAGKGNNPSLPATVSGNTVSYDFSSWVNFPEGWSEGCGVWYVGTDQFIGQGANGSCANTWNSLNDVLATMNALDPNGLTWTLSGTIASATASTSGGSGITYQVPTCANIADLQSQIDALAAAEKYVVSGVITNPNTTNATLVLTMNDGSTISINVGSLEDAFTAAQILALFPNGAATPVTVAGSTIRFLGQDGQWHALTIPATTNTLAIDNLGQIVSTVDGVSASLVFLSTVAPPADGVGDTRAGSAGVQLLAVRRDHVHPIQFIQAPPAFGDLLLTGQMVSDGAISMAATYTTEETITYRGQKPVIANPGTWAIVTPPALAGYILTSFEGSPYSPAGMDAVAGPAGGGSRDFNWMYTTYYDNVRRTALAHNLSFKAEYRLN